MNRNNFNSSHLYIGLIFSLSSCNQNQEPTLDQDLEKEKEVMAELLSSEGGAVGPAQVEAISDIHYYYFKDSSNINWQIAIEKDKVFNQDDFSISLKGAVNLEVFGEFEDIFIKKDNMGLIPHEIEFVDDSNSIISFKNVAGELVVSESYKKDEVSSNWELSDTLALYF